MAQSAAKTGSGPTVMVAIEQSFPAYQRIVVDDLASRILPFGARMLVWLMRPLLLRDWMIRATEKTIPGIWGGVMCRKRYIDEKLVAAATRVDAVVNLGAGFDTRAYRLPLGELGVWEVDQPENIERKRARLQHVFGTVPAHVKLVSIDFDRENLDTVLAADGYEADKRTFFVWEAVSQYLTEAGIKTTFDFLANAASGSLLAFTYVRKDFIEGRATYGWDAGYKKYVVKEKLWRFGLDPDDAAKFLRLYGWSLVENFTYEELAELYVRPTGRNLAWTPIERVALAEKL